MTISIGRTRTSFTKPWTTSPTVHINSSLYTERAYRIADVRVYSNAPKTSLKVNGQLLGVLADCPDRISVWNGVVLSPGANNIVASGSFPRGDVEDRTRWHLSDAAAKNTYIDCGALVAGASNGKHFGSDTPFQGGTAEIISGPGARGRAPAPVSIVGISTPELQRWLPPTVPDRSPIVFPSLTECAPLVFVRPGELRSAEWADIDLDGKEWRYTVTKTAPHIVPLSRQAVEILLELKPLTGSGCFVFPSARRKERPMSDKAILAAMRRAGIDKDEIGGHGFRAVARTILDELLGVRSDYIEHQLDHAVRDPMGAHNRTAHLPKRRKMMQQWADYLDRLNAGADVIPIRQGA